MAELFYTVSSNLHRTARIEKGEVVELDFEIPGKPSSLLGGIYLGRVVDVQKPLRAAFVDMGEKKLGFLPVREGPLLPVKQGDAVLVQVSRAENPLESKGVRLTRLITLSLGPLLYTPFMPGLSLSRKLKERESFKNLFSLRPEEGLVVRHEASLEDPFLDMLFQLRGEWEAIQTHPPTKSPLCLSPGLPLLERVLRSLNSADVLVMDDQRLANMTQGKAMVVRQPAFDERCADAWESLSSIEVSLPQGGNLYIEETQALVVIDVNSHGSLRHPLLFNKNALREVFKQIRLRELGGKIVVDLIAPPKDIRLFLQEVSIPSHIEVLGLSHMGLFEMIGRKRRLSLPQRLKLGLN